LKTEIMDWRRSGMSFCLWFGNEFVPPITRQRVSS